jgi:hypothetical protein
VREETFVHEAGGRGQFAHVRIVLEPAEAGRGILFENALTPGTLPREFVPRVERGARGALGRGALAGYPVIDAKVTLVGGSHHAIDSSESAFQWRPRRPWIARCGRRGRCWWSRSWRSTCCPRGVHRGHRGQPVGAPGPHPGDGSPGRRAGHLGRGAALAPCSDTRPTFVRSRRDEPLHNAVSSLFSGARPGCDSIVSQVRGGT